MIILSGVLVVVAIGLLIAGIVTQGSVRLAGRGRDRPRQARQGRQGWEGWPGRHGRQAGDDAGRRDDDSDIWGDLGLPDRQPHIGR